MFSRNLDIKEFQKIYIHERKINCTLDAFLQTMWIQNGIETYKISKQLWTTHSRIMVLQAHTPSFQRWIQYEHYIGLTVAPPPSQHMSSILICRRHAPPRPWFSMAWTKTCGRRALYVARICGALRPGRTMSYHNSHQCLTLVRNCNGKVKSPPLSRTFSLSLSPLSPPLASPAY